MPMARRSPHRTYTGDHVQGLDYKNNTIIKYHVGNAKYWLISSPFFMFVVSCRIFTHLATLFHVAMRQIIKSMNSSSTHPFSTLTIWA